jgi:hypothetical protein
MSAIVVLIALLPVTLALKVNALVGAGRAPASLFLVAGTSALLVMIGNALFGLRVASIRPEAGVRSRARAR